MIIVAARDNVRLSAAEGNVVGHLLSGNKRTRSIGAVDIQITN